MSTLMDKANTFLAEEGVEISLDNREALFNFLEWLSKRNATIVIPPSISIHTIKLLADALEIQEKKNADYSTRGNPLAGFTQPAEEIDIHPLKVWYIYARKHWGAIKRFVSTGRVESEPIRDRLIDLINYATILNDMLQKEDSGAGIDKALSSIKNATKQSTKDGL